MENKLPNGMTKTEMLESLKSYTDFPEVIDEAIDAINKNKSNKYLINNDSSMTRVKTIEHIDRMIDTYKICKTNGVGIDIQIDEDLEALTIARDTLSAIDIPDNPTNGDIIIALMKLLDRDELLLKDVQISLDTKHRICVEASNEWWCSKANTFKK